MTTRRMFLTGGGTALAIPLLTSLLPRGTRAQAPLATRFVQVIDNFGATRSRSMPATQPSASQDIGAFARAQPLAGLTAQHGHMSEIYGAWWNSVAPKVNLLSNYHAYTASRAAHNTSHATCASGHGGADTTLADVEQVVTPWSADAVIEKALQAADPRPFSAIRVNFSPHARYGSGNSHCFAGQRRSLPADQSFAQLAAKLTAGGGSLQRRDFFNALMGDYRAVAAHPRLSGADKQRFEGYVASINDIVRREEALTMRSCSLPPSGDSSNLAVRHDNALELCAAALSCGLTRVVSYALIAGSDTADDVDTHHTLHHDDRSRIDPIILWRSRRVAKFVEKLDGLRTEEGANLLDETVFYWGHEFANAQDAVSDDYLGARLSSRAHDPNGYTCILGGRGSGRLSTGQHVDLGHAPIGRVLVTAMKAMGLSTAQIEQGGVVGFGEYSTVPSEIALAFGQGVIDRFLTDAEKRRALPIVTA